MLIVLVIVGGVAPGTGSISVRIIGTVLGVNNHLWSHYATCYPISSPTRGAQSWPNGNHPKKLNSRCAAPNDCAHGWRPRPPAKDIHSIPRSSPDSPSPSRSKSSTGAQRRRNSYARLPASRPTTNGSTIGSAGSAFSVTGSGGFLRSHPHALLLTYSIITKNTE